MASGEAIAAAAGVEIREELGAGSRLTVYRVERDGESYVLKVGPESEGGQQRTFARRVTDLARLDAPQAPDIRTVGRADGHLYWVMDFVDGTNLADRLGDRPFEPRQAVRLGLDLLEVLDRLHAGGLVHRHLKPWSIHWDRGRGRLVDFGLLGSETPGDKMAVVESLVYAAPEQTGVLHRPVDARSDIYAVGAILYEVLAGTPPFCPAASNSCSTATPPISRRT